MDGREHLWRQTHVCGDRDRGALLHSKTQALTSISPLVNTTQLIGTDGMDNRSYTELLYLRKRLDSVDPLSERFSSNLNPSLHTFLHYIDIICISYMLLDPNNPRRNSNIARGGGDAHTLTDGSRG